MNFYGSMMSSPVGNLLLLVNEQNHLCRIEFGADSDLAGAELEAQGHRLTPGPRETCEVRRQLDEYFEKKREIFDLPLDPPGTDFQRQVWSALCEIPYGTCISYGDLARSINNAKAVRAVGAANGANPIPIVIPCHRVIGSKGDMVGYSGGLEIKTELLKLEGYLLL